MATQFFWTHQLPEEYVSPYLLSIRSTNSATLSQIFKFAHTTLFQNSFPSAISLWNTLPKDVCEFNSLSTFYK